MRKLKFIWAYITNPSFRAWVDLDAEQKYLDTIRRMMEEERRYKAKIYWQQFAPTHMPTPSERDGV